MAKVIIKQAVIDKFLNDTNGPIAKDIQRRADAVLRRAQELVPKASGDFSLSLRKVLTTQGGRPVVRITSNDPQVRIIRQGTPGPYAHQYANISRLRAWASHRGIDTSPKNIFGLARGIALHGTPPAGTSNSDLTVKQALLEAAREALK